MHADYDIVFLQPEQRDERRAIFDALVADGVAPAVFYDELAPDFASFERSAGPAVGWCVPVYHAGAFAAVGFVNSFVGRAAFAHFAFLRAYRHDATAIGTAWCRAVFASGSVDCLLGLTPAPYRHALAYIRALGFQLSTLRVPGACFLARHNRYVSGIYSLLLPKDLSCA